MSDLKSLSDRIEEAVRREAKRQAEDMGSKVAEAIPHAVHVESRTKSLPFQHSLDGSVVYGIDWMIRELEKYALEVLTNHLMNQKLAQITNLVMRIDESGHLPAEIWCAKQDINRENEKKAKEFAEQADDQDWHEWLGKTQERLQEYGLSLANDAELKRIASGFYKAGDRPGLAAFKLDAFMKPDRDV